jgi:hypothetical protein
MLQNSNFIDFHKDVDGGVPRGSDSIKIGT